MIAGPAFDRKHLEDFAQKKKKKNDPLVGNTVTKWKLETLEAQLLKSRNPLGMLISKCIIKV
jgi:hypothetical protein